MAGLPPRPSPRAPVSSWAHRGLAVAALLVTAPATAADHFDGPSDIDDPAADLGGVFAWTPAPGRVALALTIGPGLAPGEPAIYDPEVLYLIRIDDDGDSLPDTSIAIQFGEHDQTGQMGVRVRGIPGHGAIIGPVEQLVDGTQGARVWAGLRDDPAFFDAEGWAETLDTETFALDPTRDAFAGSNTLAVVIEFDQDGLRPGPLRVWATAGRWPR